MGRSVLTNGDDQRVSYNVKPLQQQIGDLTKLGTTDKTSLVNALNEVKSEKEDSSLIGDLNELNTSDKTNLVAAINSNASELAEKANQTQSEKSGLSGWLRDLAVNRNKQITVCGDSTTDNATGAQAIWSEITSYFTNSGDLLDGVTFINRGSNGNTLSNFINNTSPTGKNISDAIADKSDLYILSYLINDVRLGNCTLDQAISLLDTAIQQLLENTNGYILLRVPNSLLVDDPGNYGWVQPTNAYQTYTDLMWNAYMAMKGKYARVDVIDMQTLVFGRTCQTSANAPLMTNQLHPSTEGYKRIGRLLADYTGLKPIIRDDLIRNALNTNSTKPYLVYPKYLEYRTDLYDLVAQGYFVGMGSTYLDFGFDPTLAQNVIKGGYILKVGDVLVYDLPSNVSTSAIGTNTRLLNVSFPDYANNKLGMVKVFKPKAISPKKSFNFWGTNMSGLQFAQYGSLDNTILISTITASLKLPITTGNPTTFDVMVSSSSTAKKLGTLTFANNNMTATFAWNTTDYPNSNATIHNTDFIYLVCGTTTWTSEIALQLGLS